MTVPKSGGKEIFCNFRYTKREKFRLSEGGAVTVDFMGNFHSDDLSQPILYVLPGYMNDSQTSYIREIVRAG